MKMSGSLSLSTGLNGGEGSLYYPEFHVCAKSQGRLRLRLRVRLRLRLRLRQRQRQRQRQPFMSMQNG